MTAQYRDPEALLDHYARWLRFCAALRHGEAHWLVDNGGEALRVLPVTAWPSLVAEVRLGDPAAEGDRGRPNPEAAPPAGVAPPASAT